MREHQAAERSAKLHPRRGSVERFLAYIRPVEVALALEEPEQERRVPASCLIEQKNV